MSAMSRAQQTIVTLDLEGVLVPEIWIAVAERTGIDDLRRTTRDEPDYDKLMRGRLDLLAEHGLTATLVAEVIGGLAPLPGAQEFLTELRERSQVVILSDTFEQFAAPLMAQLGMPTILCHRLLIADDRIVDYRLRMPDQKRHAVAAFQGLNYRVVAAGDSFNDAAMLAQADAGIWFHAPPAIAAQFPAFATTQDYPALAAAIGAALKG
ncbi:MAG: bifunctional phosphoserine phosphatase/homoserine phosphotransferase ThrH [Candidatus Nanopelagicales bacterium]